MNTTPEAPFPALPKEIRLALCPHFWPVNAGLYAVVGYCASPRFPGRLIIPSLEEYRECCTTDRFPVCAWFRPLADVGSSRE